MEREVLHTFKIDEITKCEILQPLGIDAIRLCLSPNNTNEQTINYLLENLVLINGNKKASSYFYKLEYSKTLEILEIVCKFMETLKV